MSLIVNQLEDAHCDLLGHGLRRGAVRPCGYAALHRRVGR